MPESTDLSILTDLYEAVLHFSERGAVKQQILAALAVLAVAWIVARAIWFVVNRLTKNWMFEEQTRTSRVLLKAGMTFLYYITLPVFFIAMLQYLIVAFTNSEQHSGLLYNFFLLSWTYLGYRAILGLLYGLLPDARADRYHYRFVGPAYTVLVAAWLVNLLIPIRRLFDVPVWAGFAEPVTLGAIFIATIGLYLWYDGTGILQDMSEAAFARGDEQTGTGTIAAVIAILRYALVGLGLLIALKVLGFDSTMLAFVTAGLSIGIGFGSKEVISNLMSGILLLFDQSLRPGDIISIEGQMGVVQKIGIRATTVTTLNNVEVVVPNQTFMMTNVTTYTKTDRFVRMLLPVETADSNTPYQVRQALLAAAKRHPRVVDDPAPYVAFKGNGDTSHIFELAVWFEDPTRTLRLTSDLYFMIFDEFSKAGIGPSTPQRDLQILNAWPWEQGSPAMTGNGSDSSHGSAPAALLGEQPILSEGGAD